MLSVAKDYVNQEQPEIKLGTERLVICGSLSQHAYKLKLLFCNVS